MRQTIVRSIALAIPVPSDSTVAALIRRVVLAGLLLAALTILASIALVSP